MPANHPAILAVGLLPSLAALLLQAAFMWGGAEAPIDSHRPQAVIAGTVLSVGPGTLALKERESGDTIAFVVAPYAAIERQGAPVQLAALLPGDIAQVTTDTDGRERMAVAIVAYAPITPPSK